MYTVPPQYHGYADPNPSPHLANADQLMDNVFVGAPQPKGMQKVFRRVNKTVHKMGKRDPGSGTDDSDFEYQHVEDDHEVKKAEKGKKAKQKAKQKAASSLGIEDLIPSQEEATSPEKTPKKSSKTKTKKKKSSRTFQSDPLMYQHDSLAVDDDDPASRPPQPPPHNPYMLYPTHVPFGSHQTPYNYYFMQHEAQRQQAEQYWRQQQEYQMAHQPSQRRKKDKNFAYISPGDNAYYNSPEEHQRKQYEKFMGQQRQPGSWDGIIDPTQDQEYGFRSNYNPWFGAPMGHALGGVPMQEPPRHEREPEREMESEISTQVTAETGYTERTGSSGSGSGTGSGTGSSSSGSEVRSSTSQGQKRHMFPNFGALIPPPSQDEKVSRFSAKNIFGKRTVSESRESLVSRDTESSVSRDSGSQDTESRVSVSSSHHPLPVPPSPGSYVSSTTSFSLNDEPIRPQSSVSQRGMMTIQQQRGGTPYNMGGEYMMPEVPMPVPAESTVSASEEHSRALYNVWTGLTSTVKDWVSSYDQTSQMKSEAVADNFFSQVYKNAFGQPVPADTFSGSDTSSFIPQDIPLPEEPSDDDEFDARSMMEEDTVIGEIPTGSPGGPIIYEEDIENRNKKRLKKTMKFLLRKKGKDGMPVVGEVPEGAVDEQGVPIGAVLKFRRSPLTKMKRSISGSSSGTRPTSSGSAHGSVQGSVHGSVLEMPPPGSAGSVGSVSSAPPPADAPKVQQFMYQLAVLAERLQPHVDKMGGLIRSHPLGATFMYPMDAAVAVHPKLKFVALGLEIVAILCVLYVVASVVSSVLTVLRFLFAPLIWILGIGAKKKK